MKKVLFSLATIALSIVAFASLAFAQSVAGDWDITITSPQGPNTSKLIVKEAGGALSAALKNDQGELPTKISVTGSDVKINFTINFQGNDFPITLTGKVTGDTMKGDADFGGLAQGDWSAKRAGGAAAAAPAAAASSSSAAGAKWDLTFTSPVGDFPVNLTIKQDGNNLSGTAKMGGPSPQEVPMTGTLKDGVLDFKFVIKYEGNDLPIMSKGKVNGSEVSGTVDYGGMAQGDFKGKKAN